MHVSYISGITKFDLLGEFGRLDWLGNFRVVILYNLVFEISTAFCLVNKFTASVRNALYEQVHVPTVQFFRRLRPKAKASVWVFGYLKDGKRNKDLLRFKGDFRSITCNFRGWTVWVTQVWPHLSSWLLETKHCAVVVSINWIPRLKSVVHGDVKKEAESIINGNILITV